MGEAQAAQEGSLGQYITLADWATIWRMVQHLLDGGYRDAISLYPLRRQKSQVQHSMTFLQTATAFFYMSLKLMANATEIGNETGVLLSP
jgi:hypothetical protein